MRSGRVLVTGAAGFIGSNLAAALVERGYDVVGIDNLTHGSLLNLAPLEGHPRFRLVQADVRDEAAMQEAGAGCQGITHLAAFKIPRYTDALETLLVNAVGSEIVLRVALRNRSKIVAASTSDVYGKNPAVPFREDSDLVIGNPEVRRWAYAISKMFEEQLLLAYHERYGIDVVVVRLFGGYGPHQDLTWWGGPQSVFINKAIAGEEMEVHGDGLQTRSFTYVDDHVQGFIRCLETDTGQTRVFNIGATQEIAILDLARLVWTLVRDDRPPRIRLIPYETFGKYEDVRRRIPDIGRARAVLGFEPRTALRDGLIRTIAWQRERLAVLQRLKS